ncbi:unnamed protein product [Paramecium sonneborni]|uniref:AIG1-type G domain-containing protein n=1 Tax=Paramecium sonneborni TaxID=65129 RepID=A0A8S1P8D0_9CILI|nr:unnamed protein product [Paramecium sonneborni]
MQNQQQPNINIQGQFQFKNNTEVPPKFNTNMQSQQLSNNNNVNQLQFNNNMKFQQQPNSNNILSKQIVSTPQQFSNIFQTKIQQSYPLSNESTTSTQLSIPNSIQISGTEEEEKKKKNQAELESIVSRCKIVENKNTSLKICIYPTYKESQFKDISEFKTLIMIGETGVGKSTTINFFCNYYLGVQYDYPFRFLIVNETGEEFSKSQAVSKTSKVNTYFIKSFDGKPGLRIIDTPGFADTRGQEYDEIISEQITDSLKKIDSITMICFVMRANQNRLTAPQKYVMNRLLKLFGNDVVENFIFLFTFADQDDEPQALQALLFQGDKQHSPSPVAEFIAQVRCPYWLQFNNSAFLSGRKDSLLWDIACAQYKIFYEQKILLTQFVSLKLTKEVIFERKQLQNLIKNLRPELQKQLNLIGDIQNQVDNIKKLSQEELQSQNYKFSQKGYEIVKPNSNNILSKQIVSTPQQFSNIFQTKIQQSYPLSNESTTSTQLSIPNSIQISGTEEEEKKKKNQAELESIVSRCKIVENKNTSLKICIYPTYKESQFKDISEFKTLIMIGETGVGKSTTINFFCNYYLGVQYDYPFRFLIVNETGEEFSKSQAVSKTSKVNTYFIKSFDGKPGLRIIDTPGFADTRGQEYDEIISEQITDSLKKIDSITMICFVMRANQNRLTAPQKYVMNRLLKLFGNDVVENFIFLFTFADQDDEPQALQALLFQGDKQHSPSPVAEFIAQVRCPYWLQFNNSAFLSGRKDSLLWDIACAQYKIFYEQKILLTQFVSLKLTKENLIKNLRPELQKQLNLIGDIQNQVDNIKKLSQEELQSQNYKFSQKGYEIVKVNLNQNEYVTNCIKCNHTCHYPCCYRNSEDKKKCCAMSNGQCTVCKGKCNWQDHENMTFRFEVKEKITEVVMEDLKKRHQKSSSLKLDKEDILKGLKLDLQKNQIICQDQIKALLKSVNKLNEIALQPAISDCESEYIDCLINEEQQNCQAGYKERIKNLQNIKAEWDLLKKQVAK